MKKFALIAATAVVLATPAMAEDVGVHVGPVDAGVTVGAAPDHYDRDHDRTTVIKERDARPADRTTVIKKESSDGVDSKTVIHHDND